MFSYNTSQFSCSLALVNFDHIPQVFFTARVPLKSSKIIWVNEWHQSKKNHEPIEAKSCIYASLNLTSLGSDNGLLPVWHWGIILTNACLLLIWPPGTCSSGIGIQMQQLPQKNNVKMSSGQWRPIFLNVLALLPQNKAEYTVTCLWAILQQGCGWC